MELYTNVSNNNQLYIKIKTDFEIKRRPSNIIAVLDVSGSMNENASKNMSENDQLSRLDLLKHVCLTTINLLNNHDTFGIVTFSTSAKILQTNIYMTTENKKKVSDIINSLETEGTTNIYDGLFKGIQMLNYIDNNNNNSIILLTDGVSNVNPPSGILYTFKKYLSTLNLKSYNLNTFGFSDCVDSKLLREISDCGNGVYGFIPDASMVGTCFINYISSVLTTIFSNINIEIIYENNEIQYENTGAVLLEQDRDLIIKLKNNNIKNILLKHNDKILNISSYKNIDIIPTKTIIRYNIINTISNLINYDTGNYKKVLNDLYYSIKNKITKEDNEYITNYLNDYYNNGQISIAFKKEFLNKWGIHYLLSLIRSYEMQICLNFKDNGLQNYANKLFSKLRDDAEIIFLTIPPPIHKTRSGVIGQSVNMSNYYNQNGGCFDGDSIVKMYNNTYKKVKDLVKGDEILSYNNTKATIECIVITKINKKIQMCNINEMLITPYHPIYYNNDWIFPINISQPKEILIELVYNLVLNNSHVVYLNNTPVITLGDNFHNHQNIIIKHKYFNSIDIINDLSTKLTYKYGVVLLDESNYIRDNTTKEVIKIV